MRMISVSDSAIGTVLARSVLDENGKVLLGQGVCLSDFLIKRLQTLGIHSVYVQDSRTDDLIIEDAISERTRQFAVSTFHRSIEKLKSDSSRKPTMASRPQMGREFSKVFNEILDEIQSKKETVTNVASIYPTDGYLYNHAINVSILATVMGIAKGYSHNQLIDLGIGALLHDVGMLQLGEELIKKEGAYTPQEFVKVKAHPQLGYDFLRNQDGISTLSAHIALQHHERLDGSGYPRGLRNNEIHEYAKIVGICDVFDAMNTNRKHRKAFLPHDSLEFLMANCNVLFDQALVILFIKNVAIYPLGLTVLLNNGQTAVVVSINPEYPQRPKVRILTKTDGTDLHEPYEIDLVQNLSLMITKTS